MGPDDPSVTELAVLGLLAEGPKHGFAISKELDADCDVGRVFTVRRPLVYRALDRMVDSGYARPTATEQGDGPKRVVHAITPKGRRLLLRWLAEPVDHVRDLRLEFLLKFTLIDRAGDSPLGLIRAQKETLEPTLGALDDGGPIDHVELWRRHNAVAAAAFLQELEQIYS